MRISELYAEIRLKSSKFSRNLRTVKGSIKDFGMVSAKAFAMISGSAIAMGVAVGKITKDTIRYGVQIDKLSKITGMAGEQISRLQYAIEQEHGDIQQLVKGLVNLTVRLGYAGDGLATYIRYFDQLGIAYKNADGTLRNTYDVFEDLAEIVSQGSMNTETFASVVQLFGARAGKELIPFLKLGKEGIKALGDEAERLGLIFDTELAGGMKKVDDAILKLKRGLQGLKMEIGKRVAPAVQGFAEVMSESFILMREEMGTLIPVLSDIGKSTDDMRSKGQDLALFMTKVVFSISRGWTRLKVVFWTVLSAFSFIVHRHAVPLKKLYDMFYFTHIGIAKIMDKVFKTDIADALAKGKENLSAYTDQWIDFTKEGIANARIEMERLYDQEIAETNAIAKLRREIELLNEERKKKVVIPPIPAGPEGDTGGGGPEQEIIDSTKALQIFRKGLQDVTEDTIEYKQVVSEFGNALGNAFRKGKLEGDALVKTMIRIALQLALMNVPGGSMGTLFSGLFGGMEKGGFMVPHRAQRGLFLTKRESVIDGVRVHEKGKMEVVAPFDKFLSIIEKIGATNINITTSDRNIIVDAVRDISQEDLDSIERDLIEKILDRMEDKS